MSLAAWLVLLAVAFIIGCLAKKALKWGVIILAGALVYFFLQSGGKVAVSAPSIPVLSDSSAR